MKFLEELESLLQERRETLPAGSYTANLFRDGDDRILKKIGEEAGEVIIAVKNGKRPEILHEAADLLFHLQVLLVHLDLSLSDVASELEKRHR
ncbi:MAG: phosphoribosyl-ATP diphosphatase [Spirochaetales bacterium]|nr:phosphoribosyl-ATP diphosphatase [Leptospiraceae bacterium]MCP5481809.1 phosphoribosyl-ATP diphosphatase [Spirochaetales bacterium]